jgi:hypothetical protein
MPLTAEERHPMAELRSEPPGKRREFLEQLLTDRAKAVERFRRYAARAETELAAWELNWMSQRMTHGRRDRS